MPAFRGNRIDVMARAAANSDSSLAHITSNYTRGADFVDETRGIWWDMTTSGEWQKHLDKYGLNGIRLATESKNPLFSRMDYTVNGLLNGAVGNGLGNK